MVKDADSLQRRPVDACLNYASSNRDAGIDDSLHQAQLKRNGATLDPLGQLLLDLTVLEVPLDL